MRFTTSSSSAPPRCGRSTTSTRSRAMSRISLALLLPLALAACSRGRAGVATLGQVQNAQTGRDVAAAELETATFNRRYAVIVAPAAGVILRRNAEPGQLVQSGTAILVFGSRSRGVVLRAALADRDVVRLQRGDRAAVHFDALPDEVLQGTVTEIAAAADPLTGTYRVEVTLPRAARLTSGLV